MSWTWTVGVEPRGQFNPPPQTAVSDPPFTFPLNAVSGATMAFSMRKLSSSYSGKAIQLQRITDNVTQDIGFTPNGNPDMVGINAFGSFAQVVASASGTVMTVTQVISGQISVGQKITTDRWPVGKNGGNGFVVNTTISSFGTGSGGTGTYNLSSAALNTVPSITVLLTNCGVSKWYDQSGNGNDITQATQSLQMLLVIGCPVGVNTSNPSHLVETRTTYPTIRGRKGAADNNGTSMNAADSASYKTAAVDVFAIFQAGFGAYDPVADVNDAWVLGYPLTTGATGYESGGAQSTAHPWALAQTTEDTYVQASTGDGGNSISSLGKTTMRYLSHYYLSYNSTTKNCVIGNGTLFPSVPRNTGSSLSYPNAVGFYLGNGPAGTGSFTGDYAELIVYGATQSSGNRSTLYSNQSSYWNLMSWPSSYTTSDGFQWMTFYYESFPPPLNTFNSNLKIQTIWHVLEGAMAPWSCWKCTNLATGADLYRFEIRTGDGDNIGSQNTDRTELDSDFGGDGVGNTQPTPYEFHGATTVQWFYALLVESGSDTLQQVNWNTNMQCHWTGGQFPPATCQVDGEYPSGVESWIVSDNAGTNLVTIPIVRNVYHHFFWEQFVDTNRTTPADTLKLWFDGTLQFSAGPGNLFPQAANDATNPYLSAAKIGIYRGDANLDGQTATPELGTWILRYANLKKSFDKSTNDISGFIASPPADPTHS